MPARNSPSDHRLIINLSRGIQVDTCDVWLLQWRTWTISDFGYPQSIVITDVGRRKVFLHHYIVGWPLYDVVDHIDRNKLNNRRSNLRYITAHENKMNSFVGDNPLHHIRSRYDGAYEVRLSIDGNHYYGNFTSLDDAIAQRDIWLGLRHINLNPDNDRLDEINQQQPDC